jgi:predicted nucleic-acid-binding Zn-ribbon protein
MPPNAKYRCRSCGYPLKSAALVRDGRVRKVKTKCPSCGAVDWELAELAAPEPGGASSAILGEKGKRLGRRAPGSFEGGRR